MLDADPYPMKSVVLCRVILVGMLLSGGWRNSQAEKEGLAASDWPTYGLDTAEQRFSPLRQVSSSTIDKLGPAWFHEFDTFDGQQATPIVVGGVLYVSTEWSKVFAFDGATGRELWHYDPQVKRDRLVVGCCGANSRGVAVSAGKVYVAAFDGRLIALDAKSGKPLWSVLTVDQSRSYTITGAPRVIDGRVLIGNGGAEYGVRGYVSAYEATSGKLVWRFYTTPNPDGKPDGVASDQVMLSKAQQTWFGDAWKATGGGVVWDSIVCDPLAKLVYIGTGNGTPQSHLQRSASKGDNLFLASIIALRADTGEYVWHYQTTPGDNWDYDATQPMMLANLPIGGRRRQVLMQANKNGFFYVLDRLTGELLSAKSYTEQTWTTGVDMKSGRPIEVAGARSNDKSFVTLPGQLGAHSWQPMAFNPRLNLVYVPVQTIPQIVLYDSNYRFRPGHENTGLDMNQFRAPNGAAEIKALRAALKGTLVAWDPVAGKRRWTVGQPYFLNGGVLATASDLVFQGNGEGKLVAYDASDGRQLWAYEIGSGIVAPPMSYAIGQEQYIALMVGYGGPGSILGTLVPNNRLPGRLLVFKLNGNASVPPYHPVNPRQPEVAGVTSNGDADRGLKLYNDNCVVCHGLSAGSSYYAELRRSPLVASPDAWRRIVIDGAFSNQGMASFAQYLTPPQVEDIRAYVLSEARKIAVQANQ